jgi:choline dehydrogenase
MIRQSQIEQDSWAALCNDPDNWSWDTLYHYLKKSETFTPPSDYHISEAKMTLNESLHGLEGPIHYSFPGIFYNSTYEWIDTLANMGVDTRDPGSSSFLFCLFSVNTDEYLSCSWW